MLHFIAQLAVEIFELALGYKKKKRENTRN